MLAVTNTDEGLVGWNDIIDDIIVVDKLKVKKCLRTIF